MWKSKEQGKENISRVDHAKQAIQIMSPFDLGYLERLKWKVSLRKTRRMTLGGFSMGEMNSAWGQLLTNVHDLKMNGIENNLFLL